jgi:hypothetical protein
VTYLVLAILYLVVSVESVALQLFSLWRLRSGHHDNVHSHLLRTVVTRVIVMSVYVGIGVFNLFDRSTLSVPALSIYTAVAIVWQINSLADARLARSREC